MNILKSFILEEEGLSTIEISIILSVLIALGIVFRQQLGSLWNEIFKSIDVKNLSEDVPTLSHN